MPATTAPTQPEATANPGTVGCGTSPWSSTRVSSARFTVWTTTPSSWGPSATPVQAAGRECKDYRGSKPWHGVDRQMARQDSSPQQEKRTPPAQGSATLPQYHHQHSTT